MLRRLVCRLFGHKLHVSHVRRARLTGTAVGCTRCDTLLTFQSTATPARMAVPRNRH